MIRSPTCLVILLSVMLSATISAQAGEFGIRVQIDVGDRQVQTKETLASPTSAKPAPRPIVELVRDTPARVSWHAQNTSKSEEFKNVLVHFFVVKEEQTGQAEVPKLNQAPTYEGALTTDFKPHEQADWQWMLNIHEPGTYLLRVETIGMRPAHGHEHFAALDLVVK